MGIVQLGNAIAWNLSFLQHFATMFGLVKHERNYTWMLSSMGSTAMTWCPMAAAITVNSPTLAPPSIRTDEEESLERALNTMVNTLLSHNPPFLTDLETSSSLTLTQRGAWTPKVFGSMWHSSLILCFASDGIIVLACLYRGMAWEMENSYFRHNNDRQRMHMRKNEKSISDFFWEYSLQDILSASDEDDWHNPHFSKLHSHPVASIVIS